MKTIAAFCMIFTFSLGIAQETYEVSWFRNMAPETATLTVEVGDTIIWIWAEDNMPHDVSSEDPNAPEDFGSEIMNTEGSTYEYTFNEEVIFDYRCSVHPADMFGTITVVSEMSIPDKFKENINVFPNPVTEKLQVNSLFPVQEFVLYDINGLKILEEQIDAQNHFVLDMRHLASGIYFLTAISTEKSKATLRIIKR
jgi:plastocyanin